MVTYRRFCFLEKPDGDFVRLRRWPGSCGLLWELLQTLEMRWDDVPRVKGTGGKGATKLCLKMIDSLIATDIGI